MNAIVDCYYRIAYCLPSLTSANANNPSLLQQVLIIEGLKKRGHHISYFAPYDLHNVIFTTDANKHRFANRSWSKAFWFEILSKNCWRMQKRLRIPYLNFFSNLRLFDAGLQCLANHDLIQERYGIYNYGVAMACKRLRIPYILFFDADFILEEDLFGRPCSES